MTSRRKEGVKVTLAHFWYRTHPLAESSGNISGAAISDIEYCCYMLVERIQTLKNIDGEPYLS